MISVDLDFETRSELSVKDVGAHVYANHTSTEIMCLGYTVGFDEPVLITEHELEAFYGGDVCPGEDDAIIKLYRLAKNPDAIFKAHNAFFEQNVWSAIMVSRFNFPEIPLNRWRCTAAKAAQRSLPRALEFVGQALDLPVKKNMDGHNVMKQLSRTRRPSAANPDNFWRSDVVPERFQKLYAYNLDDVRAERYVDEMLPDMPSSELAVWMMDQRMNHRGLKLDLEAVRCAVKLLTEAKNLALSRFREITDNELSSPLQRDKFKKWLAARGLEMPNLQGVTIDETLENPDYVSLLGEPAFEALKMAKLLSRSSTSKFEAMLKRVSKDGRLRDYLRYYGADRTGRWSGIGVQPQNFVRIPEGFNIEQAIEDLKRYDYDTMELIYGDVISTIAYCVRGMIIASEGYEMFVSDFSGIESRVLAWLAAQEDLLTLFFDLDAKRVQDDNYCQLGSSITGRHVTRADKTGRQLGKVGELALGYSGGINAFATMAKTYRLDLDAIYPLIWPTTTEDEREQAVRNYKLYKKTNADPIAPKPGCAVDVVKQRYRKKRKNIQKLWSQMERAAKNCIRTRSVQYANAIRFSMEGEGATEFMRMELPSGRSLYYHKPRVVTKRVQDPISKETRLRESIRFHDVDERGREVRVYTYGGKLTENATQAIARDLMARAFLRIEKSGYLPLLSVHDEAISERPKGEGTMEEYNNLMKVKPKWAKGLPLHAEGWAKPGYRYQKEG